MNTLKCTHGFRGSVCRRKEFEPVVQNGLSLTPAQMMEMTNRGFSITNQNLRFLDAVDPADRDFYVPLQYRRGADIADISNASLDMRDKLKKAINKYDKGEIADVKPVKE